MNDLAVLREPDLLQMHKATFLNFRVLAPADDEAVSRLLLENPPEYMRFFNPFAFDVSTVRGQLERAKKDVFFGLDLISPAERRLAGFYMLRGLDEGYPNPMYGVFVSLPFSGKGLGRLSLAHAVTFCRFNDYERILLKVDPRNVHAKKLYESCGFRFLREEPASRDVVLFRDVGSGNP